MKTAYLRRVMRDRHHWGLVMEYVPPTDELFCSFGATGMATRMGTEVEKSWALAHVHVAYMERQFERLYTSPKSSLLDQHEAACGACVHLLAYLGWLRSGETFHGHQDNYILTEPVEGPTRNLPPGIGAIEVRLLAATKSDPTVTADVVIAFTTLSGLSLLGRWMKRLQQFTTYDLAHGLFSTAREPRWDSQIFSGDLCISVLGNAATGGRTDAQEFWVEQREAHPRQNLLDALLAMSRVIPCIPGPPSQ
jgi:hypothetical protein